MSETPLTLEDYEAMIAAMMEPTRIVWPARHEVKWRRDAAKWGAQRVADLVEERAAVYKDKTVAHLQRRNEALAKKLKGVRKAANEYKRQRDFDEWEGRSTKPDVV